MTHEEKSDLIRELRAEIAQTIHTNFCLQCEIGEHKELHTRAANALEGLANVVEERPLHTSAVLSRNLIAELRKAAQ